jgi:hypothetical protein
MIFFVFFSLLGRLKTVIQVAKYCIEKKYLQENTGSRLLSIYYKIFGFSTIGMMKNSNHGSIPLLTDATYCVHIYKFYTATI